MTDEPSHDGPDDEPIDRLTDAVDGLARNIRDLRDHLSCDLRGLQDEINELRGRVEPLCRDPAPPLRLKSMAADPLDPEWGSRLNREACALACIQCDCNSPPSLDAALRAGWSELMMDDEATQTYLGLCPDCRKRADAEELARHSLDEEPPPSQPDDQAPHPVHTPTTPQRTSFLWADE